MSVCGERHKKLDENGKGLCSVPMWSGGLPAGFCDKEAYGEPLKTSHYDGYVPFLACPVHGGPDSRVFKDGDMWCAVYPDFVNIQESVCGFGSTPEEARVALIKSLRAERM